MYVLMLLDKAGHMVALELTALQLHYATVYGTKFPAVRRAYGPLAHRSEFQDAVDLYAEAWSPRSVRIHRAK